MSEQETAAGYVRVSTDEQAEQGFSIDAQKKRIKAYCLAEGWSIEKLYCDDGWSGKTLRRPAMQEMISAVKQHSFSKLVVLKLDRLSRCQKDVLYLLEDLFAPYKIGFKSVTEPFDTTTPFGKASVGMMAVFAQLERETIVERIKIAKKEAAEQGLYLGGPLPYGYHFSAEHQIEPIPELGNIVKQIFSDSVRYSPAEIAVKLNRQGIPSPRHCPNGWSRSTIRRMLKNPFYQGFFHFHGRLTPSAHEPLAQIEQKNLYSSENIEQPQLNISRKHALLTGLLFCHECGARMRYKQGYYVCYSQDKGTPSMSRTATCRCGYKAAPKLEEFIWHNIFMHPLLQNHQDLAILSAEKRYELLHLLVNRIAVAHDNQIYLQFN